MAEEERHGFYSIMPNPFEHWSVEQVAAHNARVSGAKTEVPVPTEPKPVAPDFVSNQDNQQQFVVHVDPVPAPRMTRRDKWMKPRRPCVQRYFDYRAVLQSAAGDLPMVPDEMSAVFHFTMPVSWSQKRRQEMNGQPHRQRPDGDNCIKAIQDALFLEDGGVWRGSFEKRWAQSGRVEITMIWR